MKPLLLLLALALAASLVDTRSCPAAPTPAAAAEPTLELVALTPTAGSRLQAQGHIRAQLLY